jgi:tRNA (adenine37-N6)-methyltransferase
MMWPEREMTRVLEDQPGSEIRPGETALPFDPAMMAPDAHLVFIGHVVSPWRERGSCPKNMRQARERGETAKVVVDEAYRQGLYRLETHSHVVLLTWLHFSSRNLIVQHPRMAEQASGTFALRSPVRPNPIGLHVVKLLSLDHATGTLVLEGIDALDGTPVVDIKPYYPSTDRPDLD